jgi:hypothetical protein
MSFARFGGMPVADPRDGGVGNAHPMGACCRVNEWTSDAR